ncbi:hypothetical protein L1765_07110 [Microaerobacter geothermalis]|uniref:hypothetical protein n=1 Tax=Microaerobacter geothermalis TaxID=674972 RepID=UPI001F3756FF|nr:hypothetical protein [Microaerobacter geothermalis]MCF6093749.1 hypothetical protein [Microaerobacter geothermalis]
MRNVAINKMVQYIFTENQLRSHWEEENKEIDFDSLTPDQLMKIAVSMLSNASLSELEHHILGHGWRTEDEIEGKMISEDDSYHNMHVEVIDTEQEGPAATIVIDRILRLNCVGCDFYFYIDDLDYDVTKLKCPHCGGSVSPGKTKRIVKKKHQ